MISMDGDFREFSMSPTAWLGVTRGAVMTRVGDRVNGSGSVGLVFLDTCDDSR
jgi:hypothetical protein